MKNQLLGKTGLSCSEIGLGTWALGSSVYGDVENDEATRLVGESLDIGINFFDTAPLYGSKTEDGIAESVLGKGLGGRRDEAIISTKFGRTARNVMPGRFNAAEARESCEASLSRMGTDRIDLLFFHSLCHQNQQVIPLMGGVPLWMRQAVADCAFLLDQF